MKEMTDLLRSFFEPRPEEEKGTPVGRTERLLKLATKALCFRYGSDPTQPSIVISHLRNNRFYISVVRYGQAFAKEKRVVYKTQHADFDQALHSVATWIAGQDDRRDNPLEELREFLRKIHEEKDSTNLAPNP
jgi:hypothetical protein